MLKLQNIQKKYTDGLESREVLKCINMEIREREIVAITGASGSGKSTLLNIMGCLDSPDIGNVYLDEVCLTNLNRKQQAEIRLNYFGFVFQAFHLISTLNVKNNIIFPAYFKSEKKKGIKEKYDASFLNDVIEMCGLNEKLNSYPHQLSGGEQQRVAVARAVLSKPKIIFADEPTGNLDSKNAANIYDLLRNYATEYKTCFIYVTHEEKFAMQAESVYKMQDGKLISILDTITKGEAR